VKRLEDKVAIVTGAGSRTSGIGNGRAIAIALAREGAIVALLDLRRVAAELTHKMIAEEGGRSAVFECDVADSKHCDAVVAAVVEEFGPPAALVNNVGVPGPYGTALEVDLDSWTQTFRINVTSMLTMSRAVLPHMIGATNGSIVNMASIAGLVGGFPHVCYPTTKGAIVSMTRAMAGHHARQGIRVNCIAPGLVYTPYVAEDGMPQELREQRSQATVLGTEGTAWDVAAAAVFLASDDSRWITGTVIPVDGGDFAVRPGTPYVTPDDEAITEEAASGR
jgi:NAD(P)-dependent dehydrogenase (short-subunit alcohol dehydrogenase family)